MTGYCQEKHAYEYFERTGDVRNACFRKIECIPIHYKNYCLIFHFTRMRSELQINPITKRAANKS